MAFSQIEFAVNHSQMGFAIKSRPNGRLGAEICRVGEQLKSSIIGATLLRAMDSDGRCLCTFTQLPYSECRQQLQRLRKGAMKYPFVMVVKLGDRKDSTTAVPSAQVISISRPLATSTPTETVITQTTLDNDELSQSPTALVSLASHLLLNQSVEKHSFETTVQVPSESTTHNPFPSTHQRLDQVLSGARSMVLEAQQRWQDESESRKRLQFEAAEAAGPVNQHIAVITTRPDASRSTIFRAEIQDSKGVRLTWSQSADAGFSAGSRTVCVEAQSASLIEDSEHNIEPLFSQYLTPAVCAARAGSSSIVFAFSAAVHPATAGTAGNPATLVTPAAAAFQEQGIAFLAAAELLDNSVALNRGAWLEMHCVAAGTGGSHDVFGELSTSASLAEQQTSPFHTKCRGIEIREPGEMLPLLTQAYKASFEHDCQVALTMTLRHPLQRRRELGSVTVIASKAHSAYTERQLVGSVKYGAIAATRWLADSQRATVKAILDNAVYTETANKQKKGLALELGCIMARQPFVHSVCVVPSSIGKSPAGASRTDCEAWSGGVASSVACLASIASAAAALSSSHQRGHAATPSSAQWVGQSTFSSPATAPGQIKFGMTAILPTLSSSGTTIASPYADKFDQLTATRISQQLISEKARDSGAAVDRTVATSPRERIDQIIDQVRSHKALALRNVRKRLVERARAIKQQQSESSPERSLVPQPTPSSQGFAELLVSYRTKYRSTQLG